MSAMEFQWVILNPDGSLAVTIDSFQFITES